MANVIFYSKNRPMQLEACIRSLKTCFNEYDVCKKTVIYKTSEKEYLDGYQCLFGTYPEIQFIQQTDFKTNTLNCLDPTNKFTMFVMDDILFKNEFSLNDSPFQVMSTNGMENILSVSLRLHKGITYCYATDKSSKLPNFSRDVPNEACVWKFVGCEGDWGYGYSLDCNVYFTNHILDLINKIDFYNPNTLEDQLNSCWVQKSIHKPLYVVCYPDKAKLINVPVNRVQNQYQNRCENTFSEMELNNLFMQGKRISLNNILNLHTNSVHYPLKFEFME